MTNTIKVLLVITFLALGTSFRGKSAGNYSLKVGVSGLRNSSGRVQFALYNRDGSIPDEHYRKYFRLLRAEISEGTSEIVFADLPAGNYAVNILHDENENGKIDKGLMLPKEGIGFSNIQTIGIGNRPTFAKASFELKRDMAIRVKVIYM